MDLSLTLHNVASIISAITALGITFFTVLTERKTVNVTFALTVFFATIFLVSHVVGVNISDPDLSRNVLMFNLSVFFISAFNLHAVFAFIGKVKEKKKELILVYGLAIIFSIFFILNPDLYFLPSEPKMYFPNYYIPGPWEWTRLVFMYAIINPYMVYLLWDGYKKSVSEMTKKRHLYFMISIIISYTTAFIPNFLVYNIPVDPMWGMFFVIVFAVPFAYGVIRYEIFDIKVIAVRALLYSGAVAIIGGFITLFNYFSVTLSEKYPSFPTWIVPLLSSLIVVTTSVLIWRKLRETDLMKYEFITTVTHKFRTPLTHIKWATENLLQTDLQGESREQLKYIENSNTRLVELTGLLMNVSDIEDNSHIYHMQHYDLSKIVEETIQVVGNQDTSKKVTIAKHIEPLSNVNCDPARISFVVQTLIENACNYSPANSVVNVKVHKQNKEVIFSVEDKGIGVSEEEKPYMFTRFYRGKKARLADTEGMGVALFISKGIIEKHKGKIWMHSDGVNKGSTFTFSLPSVH